MSVTETTGIDAAIQLGAAIREAVGAVVRGSDRTIDLALVALVNDRPTFVAGSGWEGYDPARRPDPPAHTVRIFQAALP